MLYTTKDLVLETEHHYVIRNEGTNQDYWVYRKGLTCGVRCGVISGRYTGRKLSNSIKQAINLNEKIPKNN